MSERQGLSSAPKLEADRHRTSPHLRWQLNRHQDQIHGEAGIPNRRRVMRRLNAFILLTLLLTSCDRQVEPPVTPTFSAARLPTLVPTTTPPTPLPRTTMTPPPSPPPSDTPYPTTIPAPSEEQYEVVELQMVDAQDGWAIFVLGDRVYADRYWLGRTTDGGQTWINITPPAFDALRSDTYPGRLNGSLTVSVLDSQTAWAHLSYFESLAGYDVPSVVWRTDDGGRSWQTLPAPLDCKRFRVGCTPASLQFVDRQHGWMHMSLFGRNYLDYAFYHTIDGGETWERMPKFELAAGGANYLFDPIFVDANFGWKLAPSYWFVTIGEMKDSGLIWSEITRDGGYRWQELHLPLPLGLLEAAAARQIPDTQTVKIEYSFVPMGSNVVRILVSLRADYYEPPFFSAYYFSADEGRSWKPLSRVGDTFFLNQEAGWRLADTDTMALEQSTDGGVSWLAYPQEWVSLEWNKGVGSLVHMTEGGTNRIEIPWVFLDDELWPGQELRLESLHMETVMTGWGQEVGGVTVCTGDGAHTWSPCQPPDEGVLPAEADMSETKTIWSPSQPLPQELFHGGDIPARLQSKIDHGRQFEIYIESEYGYSPFRYSCSSRVIERLGSGMLGVARRCTVIYPIEYYQDYGFDEGFWFYDYYVLFDEGESRIWPNVVSMDFIDEHVGWRLLDLLNGFFRLEETKDGGETWTAVKTVAWTGEIEFVNADEGWSIAREPALRGVPTYQLTPDLFREAVLLHTIDGGQSWQEIDPVVGQSPE